MEWAQRKIKEAVAGQLAEAGPALAEQGVAQVVDWLNHQPRPCLSRQTPCAIISLGCQEARTYSRFKRRKVYAWIKAVAAQVVDQGEGAKQVSAVQA